MRKGNWEAAPLSPVQLSYAAVDAYAGLALYSVLLSSRRIENRESRIEKSSR